MSLFEDHSAKLAAIREIIAQKGWTLITEHAPHCKTRLEFKCPRGHSIFQKLDTIRLGDVSAERLGRCSCRKCGVEDAEARFCQAVSERGGRILGDFVNNQTKTPVQCAEGHIWSPRPYSVTNTTRWCAVCAGCSAKGAEEKFRRILAEKGYSLVGEYLGYRTKMPIICPQGHTWLTAAHSINDGYDCYHCSKRNPENGRTNFYQVVEQENGGKVLGEYVDARTKTPIQCREGHIWTCWPSHISNRISWCPECAQSKGEKLLYECLQNLNIPFERQATLPEAARRPYDFMTYCNQHIFIEFDGKPHFEESEYYHRTPTAFEDQKRRDIEKTQAVLNRRLRIIRLTHKVLCHKSFDVQASLWQAIQRPELLLYMNAENGKLVISPECEMYSWLTSQLQIPTP
jgi:hypothetical protein